MVTVWAFREEHRVSPGHMRRWTLFAADDKLPGRPTEGVSMHNLRTRIRVGMLAAVGAALVVAFVPVAVATTAQAASASQRMTPTIGASPKLAYAGQASPSTGLFSCQAPASATNVVPCFGPQQIRAAYDVPSNLTGAGETIVIIDAFGDPAVQSDLNTFDAQFGLPNTTINVINPYGAVFDPTNGDDVGWAGEISLDTQWAHAIAPHATIDLVLAATDQDSDILAAQQYAINNDLGDVLSQSFGEYEACQAPSIVAATHRAFELAALKGISVFASAGDDGSATINCSGTAFVEGVNVPAADPLVTSVGGTHLNADYTTGQYEGESVWNDTTYPIDFGAGGGGFSTLFAEPAYQYLSQHTGARGVPDVTYNGDVFDGVLGVDSENGDGPGAFFIFGGTSAGSPQWAAITALADQAAHHRLGALNPVFYGIGAIPALYNYAFHDVTSGNNALPATGISAGYTATRGWDAASGLGSPNVAHLISLLAL
jgi:subtilase family serine protease